MSRMRATVDWVSHGLGFNIAGDTMTYRHRCLIVLLLLSSSLYSISAPTTLPEFQQLYQVSNAKGEAEHQRSIDSIHHQYEVALEGRLLAAKKGADFAGYKELMAERRRFSSEKTLPEGVFSSHVRAAEAAKAQKLSILSSQYIGALKKLQASMMMKNLMVAAEMVEAEIQKTATSMPPQKASPAPPPPQPPRIPSAATGSSKLPITLRKGLVLHYDFAADGKDKVTDKSGEDNGGKNNGAKWVASKYGRRGVMDFDGKSHIDTGRPLIPNRADWTISLWIYAQKGMGNAHIIEQFVAGHKHRFTFYIEKGVTLKICAGNFWPVISDVPIDEWTHLVLTRSGSGFRVFSSGLLKSEISRPDVSVIQAALMVGGSKTRYLTGQLDDIMIWDRAISDDEVKKLYRMQGGK